MASDKHAKPELNLSHSQINASEDTDFGNSFSKNNASGKSRSIAGQSIIIGSDETRSLASYSQNRGSDETSSKASLSLRSLSSFSQTSGSHDGRLTPPNVLIDGSDETRSLATYSQIHGSDETRTLDSLSLRSNISHSQIYGSDETWSETSFSLGSDETRSHIHGTDTTGLDDARSVGHTSGTDVRSRRTQDVAGSTENQKNTNTNEGIDKSNDGKKPGARSKPRYLYSVTGSRDINVRIDGDTGTCAIWDICQLPDGRLLMPDYNNPTLKQLDRDYKVIDHWDIGRPVSVCMCDEEVCLAYDDDKTTLLFGGIQEKREILRKMELDHKCKGLAYHDGKLYVSDGRANIHVYNKARNKLLTYNIDTVKEKYFRDEYLTVSKDGRQLYMTHSEYLICIDIHSGEVIWSVMGDSCYMGVCVDKDNNIMVCDYWCGKIVQYSSDGEKLGDIVEDLGSPKSICFEQESKTLLVGMDANVVRRFDLK